MIEMREHTGDFQRVVTHFGLKFWTYSELRHRQLGNSLSGVRTFDLYGPSARRNGAAPGGAFVTPLKIESALTGRP